jgi:hypothetical protein
MLRRTRIAHEIERGRRALAATRKRIARAKTEVVRSRLERRLVKLTKLQRILSDMCDDEPVTPEDRAHQAAIQAERIFWSRRLITTLGVGNAAAFIALGAAVGQSDAPQRMAPYLTPAFFFFGGGLIAASALPLLFLLVPGWAVDPGRAQLEETDWRAELAGTAAGPILTLASMAMFLAGLGQVAGYFNGLR